MQFLKIMFWCLLAFVAALFTYGNWVPVSIQLWSGMEALVKLPFLLLLAFLVGFVPTYAYQRTLRWRLKQRLMTSERLLGDARIASLPAEPMMPISPTTATPMPIVAMAEPETTPEGRLL